jgi:hypothetical protein
MGSRCRLLVNELVRQRNKRAPNSRSDARRAIKGRAGNYRRLFLITSAERAPRAWREPRRRVGAGYHNIVIRAVRHEHCLKK